MKETEPACEVTLDIAGRHALLTLNRADKHNALNSGVLAELKERFCDAESSREVRAIVITGAGSGSFCAGADLEELEGVTFGDALRFLELGQEVFSRIHGSRVPVIAAVNGYALGGGLELALACHVRVASTDAKFGFPEAGLGMIPAFGGTQRLPRLVGLGAASEIMLTGRRVRAEEALRIGMVSHICQPGELMDLAVSIAEDISKKSPVSIEMILDSLRIGSDIPMERAQMVERFAGAAAASSGDQRIGIRAFMDRKEPEFTGWERSREPIDGR